MLLKMSWLPRVYRLVPRVQDECTRNDPAGTTMPEAPRINAAAMGGDMTAAKLVTGRGHANVVAAKLRVRDGIAGGARLECGHADVGQPSAGHKLRLLWLTAG